ncbi:hypothetical protein V5036_08635 [Enterobacter cloacae]|uniref:hypothetical protein n=1 Tax=Enterobacter cloacae TaxID=550 RepID=UPI00307604E9
MDFYIYFPEEGDPQKLGVMAGSSVHTQPFLKGPKAGTYEQYPIRTYVRLEEDGSKEVFLVAYASEPSLDKIEQAIVKLKLPPTTNYQDDNEE